MINKFNDTLHTSFFKHNIYHNVLYILNQYIYPLPAHTERAFEILDKLVTSLMHAVDKKFRSKITGCVKWSLEYEKLVDLVELWVLL